MIEIPPSLTRNSRKRDLFGGDPYFRDAWDDIVNLWPDSREQIMRLHQTALVVFRPDAIVSRRIEFALEIFNAKGLTPVAVTTFKYDRMRVREGWRYQLNIATRDRIDVMDMLLTCGRSIMVLYRQDLPDAQLPTTVWLSEMKGPSLPAGRAPGHLRFVLGKAQVSVLTFVHISDEPADVVRELGVFLPYAARQRALRSVNAGRDVTTKLRAVLNEQYASSAEHDLLMANVIQKIRLIIREPPHRKECDPLVDRLNAIQAGASSDWRGLLKTLKDRRIQLDRWDEIAIAAELCQRHFPDMLPVIPDVGLDAWTR
ncbi:nucleoside-diphosphate kinase [Bradyrhizobium sp. CB1717]|uniref:nucleoside-diphosphate kinase n=1 Tax=Bradyrhizobium sp. CB1717 TaxID=3039154 RepID=UPI0024B16B12|nr:nucleoside-diphosphate kinase [Bradyrhizobium sp. CB1717]WFU25152.1 nucleoside-diphosphate kinase [Bradyrhizobium sp. CB1717]